MAQGSIRKGFLFYFGLFVLLLFAIFMVCLVVMMFNPGKTVLWMQYFTDNTNYVINKTNDNQPIDWGTINELEIDCSYADVTIDRCHDDKLGTDGLYIKNGAKGFTASKGAVKFKIDVKYVDDNKVKVEVSEPTGFLYFSKNVTINLHAASQNSNLNFDNLNLVVKTKDGDVNIGGISNLAPEQIKLRGLDVTTTSGSIIVSNMLDTTSIKDDIKFETDSGKILSNKEISYTYNGEYKNGTGIIANSNVTLNTGKGGIDLDVLRVVGDANLQCMTGYLDIKSLSAENIKVRGKQGNHQFGEVVGNLDYSNSSTELRTPNIMIERMNGNFVFQAGDDANPTISIGEITGKLIVSVNRGKLNADKVQGEVDVRGNKLGTNLSFVESYGAKLNVLTDTSSVNLTFLGSVPNDATIKTKSGDVNFNITNQAKFIANLYKYNEENLDATDPVDSNKINVNIGEELPFSKEDGKVTIGISGNNTVKVNTNGKINFNLI